MTKKRPHLIRGCGLQTISPIRFFSGEYHLVFVVESTETVSHALLVTRLIRRGMRCDNGSAVIPSTGAISRALCVTRLIGRGVGCDDGAAIIPAGKSGRCHESECTCGDHIRNFHLRLLQLLDYRFVLFYLVSYCFPFLPFLKTSQNWARRKVHL